jgi:hypothetical protein
MDARGLTGRGVKMTNHLHLVPRTKMVELYLHTPYIFMVYCLFNLAQGQLYLVHEFRLVYQLPKRNYSSNCINIYEEEVGFDQRFYFTGSY